MGLTRWWMYFNYLLYVFLKARIPRLTASYDKSLVLLLLLKYLLNGGKLSSSKQIGGFRFLLVCRILIYKGWGREFHFVWDLVCCTLCKQLLIFALLVSCTECERPVVLRIRIDFCSHKGQIFGLEDEDVLGYNNNFYWYQKYRLD